MKEVQGRHVIDGTDGPTTVFVLDRNKKPTFKQRLYKFRYQLRKAWVEKHISDENHTLEEVCEYIRDKYGLQEIDQSAEEYQSEYAEMRKSFIMQYSPELLGEYAERPRLESHSEEDVQKFFDEIEVRKQVATKVSRDDFDIEFHKFRKQEKDSEIHIIVEKRFGYIGGGASGNKKAIRQFDKMYKDIYRYYGVTESDIADRTKRYEELIRALARK